MQKLIRSSGPFFSTTMESFFISTSYPSQSLSLSSSFSTFSCNRSPINFNLWTGRNPSQPTSKNFIFWKGNHLGYPISITERSFCLKASSDPQNEAPESGNFQGSNPFFRSVLGSMESVYLNRNPTAKAVLGLVQSSGNDKICYDHLAFRTFGVNGHGIDSMAKIFLDYGYTQKDELRFPAKKLKAYWFSPPSTSHEEGSGVRGPLPRVFISELLVEQMSYEAQEIIKKYTAMSGEGKNYSALASSLGSLTWEKPLYSEFQQLARESEYAAWTLVNGYALNHVTISVHRLKSSRLRSINNLNQFIEENGFKLNSEGGVLKVSPDGFLLQSSTVADTMPFEFSDDTTESVPCSYIEFAERLVLPQYKNLSDEEVKEFHRRDGFEVGNADKIFESTSREQLTRRTA